MLGHTPNLYWKIMWRAISPLLIIALLIYYIVNYIMGGAPTYQAWDKDRVSWILLLSMHGCMCPLSTPLQPVLVESSHVCSWLRPERVS